MAYITHWNIKIECYLSLVTAICSFFLLKKVVLRLNPKINYMLLLLLSLVWFTPIQWTNFVWGWQLEWLMSVLGVMVVASGITLIRGKAVSNASLALILLGGLLAQYSLGSGTLIWPVVVAMLLLLRVQPIKTGIVAAVGTLSTALYFTHYVSVTNPPKTLFIHEPMKYIAYVLYYLGEPLIHQQWLAIGLGFLLLIVFTVLGVHLLFRQKELFNKSSPWILLGLYAIASGLITGIARLGIGQLPEAYYSTISVLLLVGVIMLYWQNKAIFQKLTGNTHDTILKFVALVIFGLILIGWIQVIHPSDIFHSKMEAIWGCTRDKPVTTACLQLTDSNPEITAQRLQYIKSVHWSGY